MRVKRPGERSLSPRFTPRESYELAEPPGSQVGPAETSLAEPGQSRGPRRRRWLRKLKALAAFGVLTEGAVGGFLAPAPPVVIPPPQTTSLVMSATPPTVSHLASGGEYLPNAAWRAMGDAHGEEAAEHLASRVVDLAARHGGIEALTPEIKHHLIQLVMTGIGGLDPDEAADIIEVATDNADDARLGSLIRHIDEWVVPGPGTVRRPPDDPPLRLVGGRVFLAPGAEALPGPVPDDHVGEEAAGSPGLLGGAGGPSRLPHPDPGPEQS